VAAACIHASLGVITITLLLLVAPLASEEQTPIGNRLGRISAASHINLRSGPGISHPPVMILKNGEAVHVETLEGSWYRVSLPQGQKGYIYREFLEFPNGEPGTAAEGVLGQPVVEPSQAETSPETVPVFSQVAKVKSPPEAAESVPPIAPDVQDIVSPPRQSESELPPPTAVMKDKTQVKLPTSEPPSRKVLFWIIMQWVVAPLCLFALGWIFGGNYYLRRDRIERNTLRF
jgi:uncharacterized protein YraI